MGAAGRNPEKQKHRRDKFLTNLGFGAFLNVVRGQRVRNFCFKTDQKLKREIVTKAGPTERIFAQNCKIKPKFFAKKFLKFAQFCASARKTIYLPVRERGKIIAINAKSMTHGQLDHRACQLHDDTASQLSNLRQHPCGSLQNQSRLWVAQKYAANFAANFVANFLANFRGEFCGEFF